MPPRPGRGRTPRFVRSALVCFLAQLLAPALASAELHHYLVVEVRDGVPEVVHHSLVDLSRDASKPPSPTSDRSRSELRAELVDPSTGAVVFDTLASASSWLRGEFHGDGTIDGTSLPLETQTYVLRVPAVPGAFLRIHPAGGTSATFDPESSGQEEVSNRTTVAPPPVVEDLPGWSHGNPGNRVDLLVVGEGYRSVEQNDFRTDAEAVVASFLSIGPYAEYANYVNVKTLFTPSTQSGADHPPYQQGCQQSDPWMPQCCPESGGPSGQYVDTAFDATFCAFGIQRLLVVDSAAVFAAAAASPDWDHVIVVVNDPTYGGSGGAVVVASLHDLAPDLVQHEYGHSFTRLADEYSSPYPGYPACSDVSSGVPRCEANVTDVTSRQTLKWKHWVASTTAIPTTTAPAAPTDAGSWEGARYRASGMYRQGYDCIMKNLGRPICDVDGEAYALRLYRGGWGAPAAGIRLIEPGTESPSGTTVTADTGEKISFAAQVLGPTGGPDPIANWYRNGQLVSTGPIPSGATASREEQWLDPGTFTMRLEMLDGSETIHSVNSAVAKTERSWSVKVGSCPGGGDADRDGICDQEDNCPGTSNAAQTDSDDDGVGDVCDVCPLDADDDRDGDGLCANHDNCPQHANPHQDDADHDGAGDACDVCPLDAGDDLDQDGLCADQDNCPADAENDADGDGLCADQDNCPGQANASQEDADLDGVGDACDNCKCVSNWRQADGDFDGSGNACDLGNVPLLNGLCAFDTIGLTPQTEVSCLPVVGQVCF